MRYSHIVRAVAGQPWAILPAKMEAILGFLEIKAAGGDISPAEIQAVLGAAAKPIPRTSKALAILPLFGVISQRQNLMEETSGGTSTQKFAAAFRQVMAMDSVGAVVIEIDSPGGTVYGVEELAQEIYEARGSKPIVAQVNSLAASAAYWIASAADQIIVTPGGDVGSIGVMSIHTDLSEAAAKEGVKTTVISAGKYKAEASPFEPLDDDYREHIQGLVDQRYGKFVDAVARGRGVSAQAVRDGYGQGRVVTAADALKAGMVDRISTMEATLARLTRGGSQAQAPGLGAVSETVGVEDSPGWELLELVGESTEEAPLTPQEGPVENTVATRRRRLALQGDD